ncbi:MAG: hypothetical protein PVG98_05590 [Chromatiales bacterium]|jgi:hypothetical protein
MNDSAIDRLFRLLPAVHRARDEERGGPLRALLQVIAEQVSLIETDIEGLYDNWFIETCDDWVVPYIGDLVGWQPVHEAGAPGEVKTEAGRARNRIIAPRRDVANTIRNRRRKGTLALLELLARDVADWPARAVELYTLSGWAQHLDHLHLDRGTTTELRDNDRLARIDGPFGSLAHTVDVRRIESRHTPGRYNIPSVALHVWRLRPYSVTRTPAACVEEYGPHSYTFSVLGHDSQLFTEPESQGDPTAIAGEMNLPVPIRRWAFESGKERYYGEGRSIAIWVPGWGGYEDGRAIPARAVVPADLCDWSYRPGPNQVAVDPVLGRLVFPTKQLPKQGVRVAYRYGFSADTGGGEYRRLLSQPGEHVLVRVGEGEEVRHIGDAWEHVRSAWDADPAARRNGVIEITDSGVYVEQLAFELGPFESLQVRAAAGARPVLRLLDWQTDMPDALRIALSAGSRATLDGLLITGRSVAVRGNPEEAQDAPCPGLVEIRHCTLVPGWSLVQDCAPRRPAEPSLEVFNVRMGLRIHHSIVGSIQISQDQVRSDPMPVDIADSILDATSETGEALGGPGRPVAHAVLTIRRTTVFGQVQVHAFELAEDSIFTDCVCAARRQLGCMRFCYVPAGCRTPKRYRCQPDLAEQRIEAGLREAAAAGDPDLSPQEALEAEIAAARKRERTRVHPRFASDRYGRPDYAQLSSLCAGEIKRGAHDESEMGAFHDLYNPQREANLRARLDEYAPAGMDAGVLFEN